MKVIKHFLIVMGLIFFTPILFFVMGILIGCFYPDVSYSKFYEYYWFMFPFLFPGGIFAGACYSVFLKGQTDEYDGFY